MGFITLRMLESLCQIFKWMGWWITLQHMILRKKFWNKSFQFLEFSILFISMRLVLGTNAMLWNIPISHHTYKIRNFRWLVSKICWKYCKRCFSGKFSTNHDLLNNFCAHLLLSTWWLDGWTISSCTEYLPYHFSQWQYNFWMLTFPVQNKWH